MNTKNHEILHIEDNKGDYVIVKAFLLEQGSSCKLKWAQNLTDAFEIIKQSIPDLVLLDLGLTESTGIETFHRFHSEFPNIPVIVMTGLADSEVAMTALRGGAQDYLVKGQTTAELTLRAVTYAIERHRSSIALAESEAKLSYALRIGKLGHWEHDYTTNLFTFTDEFYALLKTNAEEMGGYTMSPERYSELFFYPEDADAVASEIQKTIESADKDYQAYVEHRVKFADGSDGWVAVRFHAIKDENGKTLKTVGVNQDVTDQKEAEQQHRESETRYRTIYKDSRDALMILKPPSFHFVSGDKTAQLMFGVKDEYDLISYGPLEFSPEFQPCGCPSIEKAKEMIEIALRDGSHLFEWTHKRIDGGDFPATVLLSRLVIDGDVALLANVRDISIQKKAESALQASEELFRTVIEQAGDGYELLDEFGNYLDVNIATCNQLGYTREEMLRKSVPELDPLYPQEAFTEVFHSLRGNPPRILETTHTRKDGTTFPVEITAAVTTINGEERLVSLVRDITERKQTEAEVALLQEQLAQMQKMESVGRLAGGIAHDFNNLLTVILGFSELLLEDLRGAPEDTRVQLKEIVNAGKKAQKIVSQLLAFSRKQVLDVKVVDLNDIVHLFEKMLGRLIGEDVEVVLFLADNPCMIKADRSQIEQILLNLAVNARDAMPSGGKLTIETSPVYLDEEYASIHFDVIPGEYFLLAVSDTGIGMDKDTMSRIFEPFFTTKPIGKGTGLGLSTVFGIVKQHEGHINVFSEIGCGTTFKIYLPICKDATTQEIDTAVVPIVAGTGRILVVEDDATIRSLITRLLGNAGYSVHVASGLSDALRIIDDIGKIDLLITDVVMPEANGKQVFEIISKIQPDVRVLYMSGYTQNVVAHHGVLDSGTKILQKPFSYQTLLKMVHKVLND